jgi:hypothetical protein
VRGGPGPAVREGRRRARRDDGNCGGVATCLCVVRERLDGHRHPRAERDGRGSPSNLRRELGCEELLGTVREPGDERREDDQPTKAPDATRANGRAKALRLKESPQRPAGTEEERLDRRERQLHAVCDLGVRKPFDLAEENDPPVTRLKLLEGGADRVESLRLLGVDEPVGKIHLQLDLARAPGLGSVPPPRCVPGDPVHPGSRLLRLVAPPERPIGVEERRLRHFLGVGTVADVTKDVAVDLAQVASVEAFERPGVQCGWAPKIGRHECRMPTAR